MSRNTYFLVFGLCLFAGILGYLKYRLAHRPLSQKPTIVSTATPSASPTLANSSPEQLLSTLSARQKILQLIAYPVVLTNSVATSAATPSPISNSAASFLVQNEPGFITLFGNKVSAKASQQAVIEMKSRFAPNVFAPLFAVDHEGGSVQRLSGKGFTSLPSWQAWCSTSDSAKNEAVQASAQELKQTGLNIIFGPVVDVATSSSFLRSRLCASDPQLVLENAEAWGKIFAGQGILPVIKHYPGIGTSTKDLHTTFTKSTPSQEEQHLFGQILSDFPSWGVMVSHSGFEKPCSLDSDCIAPLRKAFPDTLVFTDSLEMKALQGTQPIASGSGQIPLVGGQLPAIVPVDLATLSIQALQAGNDVLVFGGSVTTPQFEQLLTHLTNEYQSNSSFKNQVDEHLKRVLQHKQMMKVQ